MSTELRGSVQVRTYKAKTQKLAADAFTLDSGYMAARGYYPTSQSWAPGSWGAGAFIIALLLAIFIIGILIFIYLLIVKPDGTLTVTYQLQRQAVPEPTKLAPNPMSVLDALVTMKEAGHITDEDFEAKKVELLGRI